MVEWTGARYADTPTVEVRTWIGAPPERVWELVSDVARMAEFSDELRSAAWLDGATGPAVGARFTGRNSNEARGEWTTTSRVVECEPARVLAWDVDGDGRPGASWRFRLEPRDGGTALTQWFRMGPGRSGLSQAIERMPDKEQKIVFVRLRDLERAMTDTVGRIKARAES